MKNTSQYSVSGARRARRSSVGSALLLTMVLVAHAVPAITPTSDEIFIGNTTSWAYPNIAMADNGDSVVVRIYFGNLQGQRFDGAGNPLGGEFVIADGYHPFADSHVASAANGEFVVSASKNPGYLFYGELDAYYSNADGTPSGNTRVDIGSDSDVAISAQGDFVVVWDRLLSSPGIQARRFDRSQVPISDRIPVTITTPAQPAVAMNRLGEFVVVWEEADGSGAGIMGRCFDAANTPSSEFQVNQETLGDQEQPDVAIDDQGNFLVTWTSPDSHGTGVFSRRFSWTGIAITDELRINTEITGDQANPSAAMDNRGGFVVGWQSSIQDSSGYGVFLQAFRPDGERDPESPTEIQVNQTINDDQYRPSVDLSENGHIGIAWKSQSPTNTSWARMFYAGILASDLFADGFESGDTTGWSVTVDQ